MAARSNKRVSEGFYNASNDVSTADFLGKLLELSASLVCFYKHSATMTSRRQFFKVERIFLVLYQTNFFPLLLGLLPVFFFFRNSVSSYVQQRPYCNREYN